MTVENTTRRVEVLGNGVATSFSFNPMIIFESSDLQVYKRDADGVQTLLSEGNSSTTYAVVVSEYPGTGYIVYPASGGTPLDTGEKLVMIRRLPMTQDTDLETQGGYSAEEVEQALDRQAMINLQMQEEIDRCVKVTETSDLDPDALIESLQNEAASAAASAEAAQNAAEAAQDAQAAAEEVAAGLAQASETQAGIAEIATTTEVATGTDDARIVTPLKLKQKADADAAAFTALLPSLLPLRGFIDGLIISRNATVTSLDIAAGVARDDGNTDFIVLSSAITKSLNSTWAVGTGNGGLDTGVKANSTTYHIWLIKRSDTGVVDVLFSTSATAPTMPTNYDLKRRIGSRKTDSSGDWVDVVQIGDTCLLKTAVNEFTATNPGTGAVTRTFSSVPTGVKMEAIYTASVTNTEGSRAFLAITSLDQNSSNDVSQVGGNANQDGTVMCAEGRVFTNTSAQVRTKLSFSGAGTSLTIVILGWVDRRGRDA